MKKDKKIIIIFLIIVLLVICASYFLYSFGITKKLGASASKALYVSDTSIASNYPIINMVINSSGEKYVNCDVSITINASDDFNIKSLEYSKDMKNWKQIGKMYNKKNVIAKINFSNESNDIIYIRAINENGFASYAYKTYVKIDKTRPIISINKNIITVIDNVGLSNIQYSYDGINWDDKKISGKRQTINFDGDYEYARAVDHVGNISKIININNK